MHTTFSIEPTCHTPRIYHQVELHFLPRDQDWNYCPPLQTPVPFLCGHGADDVFDIHPSGIAYLNFHLHPLENAIHFRAYRMGGLLSYHSSQFVEPEATPNSPGIWRHSSYRDLHKALRDIGGHAWLSFTREKTGPA